MNESLNLRNRINPNYIFWDFVNNVNWYNLSKTTQENAVNTVSEYLINNYTLNEIIELQREEVGKRCEIEDFINSYLNGLPTEERGQYKLDNMETIDLASHIVGLGETMYNYVKDNPQIIFNLQNEYLPCFEDSFDKAVYSINLSE